MLVNRDPDSLRNLAFRHQYNLIALGGAVAFALALPSVWPLVLGVVGEMLWLGIAVNSDWFRTVVEGKVQEAQARQRAADEAALMSGLQDSYAGRVRSLLAMANEIRRLARERGIEPLLLDGAVDRLDVLIGSFVKMALLHQRLSLFLAEGDAGQLEEDILRLGQALSEERDASVRLSLRQALTLGQRRLKQRELIDSQRRALGVKMGTLEMSFDYLRSHIFSGSPPEELAVELQELIASASFLTTAEAEANASLARLTHGTSVTRVTQVGSQVG